MSNDDVLAAQIKSSIITKIKTQEYLPGELLPSERDFATMYSVSRYLIHDIFDELISQHYLIRVQGKGTFVRKPEQNRVALGVLNESKNASFTSLVRNFGIEISNKCLGTGIIKNKKYMVFIEFVLETRNLLQLSLPMFLFIFFQISIITILSTYRFMII